MADLEKLKRNLEERGFAVSCFDTAEEAAAYLDAALDQKTIGIGGSVTIQEMGLAERLGTHNRILSHWTGGTQKEAAGAQVYLSSVNGAAETGELINIDGTGNRVASGLFGHEKVYFIIGQNKVAPDYDAALWMPEVQVNLYPDSGSRRVVEVFFTYPEDPEVLSAKRVRLEEAVLDLADTQAQGDDLPAALFQALRSQVQTAEEGSTAYAALVEGAADSQGMALAYKALCDQAGVECQVVEGTLDGAPRFWTIVAWGNGNRHVDPSWGEGLLLDDAQMAAAGYLWDTAAYPVCGEAAAEEAQEG